MSLYQTTPVPNALFDIHLSQLKEVELKVLLVILRKTVGFAEEKNPRQRKEIQKISVLALEMDTGSSRRGISIAIQSLIDKNLIKVFDCNGNLVNRAEERRGKYQLYFKAVIKTVDALGTSLKNMPMPKENFSKKSAQNLPNTIKEIHLKKEEKEIQEKPTSYNPFHIISHLSRYKLYGRSR